MENKYKTTFNDAGSPRECVLYFVELLRIIPDVEQYKPEPTTPTQRQKQLDDILEAFCESAGHQFLFKQRENAELQKAVSDVYNAYNAYWINHNISFEEFENTYVDFIGVFFNR